MRPAKAFTIRVFAYSAALLYLAADLFWLGGPVSKKLRDRQPGGIDAIEAARKNGVAALVFGKPIYLAQLERATIERLWLEGKSLADLSPADRHKARLAALSDLIDHELLRTKVQANQNELPVTEAEVDAALARFQSRFPDAETMNAELQAEGINSEKELRLRLGARIQQLKYIQSRIAGETEVTEDEAREWFDAQPGKFDLPARFRARHIFLATLGKEAEKVRETLQATADAIRDGTKKFEEAAAISDDPGSKSTGGDLGWLTADRLPADFHSAIADLPLHQPTLIRTKLGWHLVEITDRRPAQPRSFDDAKAEVIAALRSAKLDERSRALRQAIRRTDDIGIHIYSDLIPSE